MNEQIEERVQKRLKIFDVGFWVWLVVSVLFGVVAIIYMSVLCWIFQLCSIGCAFYLNRRIKEHKKLLEEMRKDVEE